MDKNKMIKSLTEALWHINNARNTIDSEEEWMTEEGSESLYGTLDAVESCINKTLSELEKETNKEIDNG